MSESTKMFIDNLLHVSILPVIFVIGLVGNCFNLYIFTRPALYRSCSKYFLAGAINSLTLILFGTTTRWLGHAFTHLDATTYSLFFCRLRNYLINIIYNLGPYFIACVTVDRFCSSSNSTRIRRLSSRPQIPHMVIGIIITTAFISFIHILIYYTIVDSLCQPKHGLYTQFYSFFTTVYYFTPVLIIIIFGIGTIHNIRAQRRRVQTMIVTIQRPNRKRTRNDSQILLILLVNVISFTLFAMPYHMILMAAAINPSLVQNSTYIFIQNLTIIALNFSQAIDCYVYTFTNHLYREEMTIIIRRIFRRSRLEPTTTNNIIVKDRTVALTS